MDKYLLAQTFAPSRADEWRFRKAEAVSVQSDYTMTIRIAGSSEDVTGVRYIGEPAPPGAGVWVLTNGSTDVFAVAPNAAAGRTISPLAYRTTDQAINNASVTPIVWEAATHDPHGFVTASAEAVTITIPGRYMATAQIDYASNGTGVRSASIEIDSTTVVGASRIGAFTGVAHMNVTSVPFTVSASAEVRVQVEQNSGSPLNVVASGSVSPALSVYYLGP